jgi:hypothetical protein
MEARRRLGSAAMGTNVGVGSSQHRNTRAAGREAAERALAAANVTRADFVIVYTTVGHDPAELLPAIRAATGRAPLTGCSVSGCITRSFADESAYCVEVMVIASDELAFHHARVPDISQDPEAGGRGLGEALRPHFGDDAVALLFFGDAFTLNYTAVKKGIDEALGVSRFIPVLGGGSNNDVASTRTFQFHDDEIHEKGGCATLISGRGEVVSMVTHGCSPIGMVQRVTRSKGNVIYELDGVPSLDVIKTYVTEEENQNWLHTVNNLCLGLEVPDELVTEYDKFCIRYMVARDPAAGSITIQTEAPEGMRIWLARRDPDRMYADAERVANAIRERIGERKPKLMLHFECTGRGKLLLREQVRGELLRRIRGAADDAVPWFGAYVGGEIAPVGGTNMFHNYTAVVAAVL